MSLLSRYVTAVRTLSSSGLPLTNSYFPPRQKLGAEAFLSRSLYFQLRVLPRHAIHFQTIDLRDDLDTPTLHQALSTLSLLPNLRELLAANNARVLFGPLPSLESLDDDDTAAESDERLAWGTFRELARPVDSLTLVGFKLSEAGVVLKPFRQLRSLRLLQPDAEDEDYVQDPQDVDPLKLGSTPGLLHLTLAGTPANPAQFAFIASPGAPTWAAQLGSLALLDLIVDDNTLSFVQSYAPTLRRLHLRPAAESDLALPSPLTLPVLSSIHLQNTSPETVTSLLSFLAYSPPDSNIPSPLTHLELELSSTPSPATEPTKPDPFLASLATLEKNLVSLRVICLPWGDPYRDWLALSTRFGPRLSRDSRVDPFLARAQLQAAESEAAWADGSRGGGGDPLMREREASEARVEENAGEGASRAVSD